MAPTPTAIRAAQSTVPAGTLAAAAPASTDQVAPGAPPRLTAHEHDMVVRYCLVAVAVILVTAALSVTREISLPLMAGIVFGMVLGPAVDWLAARRVPPALAAGVIVLAGLVLLVSATVLLAMPVTALSAEAPKMVAAIQGKVDAGIAVLRDALHLPAGNAGPASGRSVGALLSQVPLAQLAVLSSAALAQMLVFFATVYFYLATRRHLKAQALRLCLGREARKSAGHFFERIENRVAGYLGMITVINLCCGALAAGIAWSAGMAYPLFWGALAAVLNYLYVVGPVSIIGLFFAANLLTADSAVSALWPAGAYLLVHLLESNVVTPQVVGHRLTLSPFLVFVSFVFWLWLWGPVGAVLATPILILAVVARETVTEYREAMVEAAVEADAP